MNLLQIRAVVEIARCRLSVSEAAEALHISQPGVSRQLRMLEDELGVEVFVRRGKRLVGVTEAGATVLAIAARMLDDAASLKRAAAEFSDEKSGTLTLATTHTQARYALPHAVAAFKKRYPGVRLVLHQGNPTQICELVATGEADLCIATEAIAEYPDLVSLPCYQWNRCVVVPPRHALLRAKPLTLEAIARHPIVTYDFAFANRSLIERAFSTRGLAPNVVLTALDADVIKTYVGLGLGVGIMAKMAFDPVRDRPLHALDAQHLFQSSTTRLGIKRGAWLRRYAYDFIETFAPQLPRSIVERAVKSAPGSDFQI